MKKYSLMAAMLLNGVAAFAAESTTQNIGIFLPALENIFVTQPNVTMTAAYDPTSGASGGVSGGGTPRLVASANAGNLIVFSTTPADVTVSFTALSQTGSSDTQWTSADVLTLTAGESTVNLWNLGSSGSNVTLIDTTSGNTEQDGTQSYALTYNFTSTDIGKGQGTLTGLVTFTATAAESGA